MTTSLPLSQTDLDEIKNRVSKLDLKDIKKYFIKDLDKEWGDYVLTMNNACEEDDEEAETSGPSLQTILDHWGGDLGFASLVAKEYQRFLLVKCVETELAKSPRPAVVATTTSSAPSVAQEAPQSLWSVKAHPSKLVDIFWHCHMLRRKSFVKCREVIGSSAFKRAFHLS